MKKFVTKQPIVNIILGVLLLGLSITVIINQELLDETILYIGAGLIVLYATMRIIKEIKIYEQGNVRGILVGEFLIAFILAVLLAFVEFFTIAIVLGLVIYIQGASHLLILQVLRKVTKLSKFLLYLGLVTLGTFIIFEPYDFEQALRFFVIGLLGVYGLIFLIVGISVLVKRQKAKPKKDGEIQETSQDKPAQTPTSKPKPKEEGTKPPKPESSNAFTKEKLKTKTVNELRSLCKERKMTGYANLTKDQLVERLWRYEKEHQ